MPTYAYHCASCNANHDVSQKITEEPLKICPSCNKPTLKRGPGGGIGIAFKGSGFYKNDYASGSAAQEDKGSGSDKKCCPCGKNQNQCGTGA